MKHRPSIRTLVLLLLLLIGGSMLVAHSADAQVAMIETAFKEIAINLLNGVLNIVRQLFFALLGMLLKIGGYNNFLESPVVQVGWVLVRDVANLFFILMLLGIAFSTIMGSEKLSIKTHLIKLLLMALFINFSKMISGIMIDFSQVFMLTFANAIQGSGGFAANIGVLKMGELRDVPGTDFWGLLLNTVLGIIFIVLASLVVGAAFVLLLARILALWILVTLSPFAFALSAIPQLQKYASQWWEQMAKNLTSGPVLMFFLWLAFSVQDKIQHAFSGYADIKTGVGPSQLGTADSLVTFAVSLGLLMVGINIAVSAGGAGASAVGTASQKIQKWGKDVGKFALRRGDDLQAGLQQRVAGSGAGKWLAQTKVGKLFGGEKTRRTLEQQGVAFRTVPGAMHKAQERYEERKLRESGAAAEDIMNRTLPWGRTESNQLRIARGEAVEKEKKEIAKGGTEKKVLLARLKNEFMEEDKETGKWKAKQGFETKTKATLELLTANHDLNEVLKDDQLGAAHGQEYNPQTAMDFIRNAFDDKSEAAEVMESLGQIGLAGNDALLYQLGQKNMETDEYEFYDDIMRNDVQSAVLVQQALTVDPNKRSKEQHKALEQYRAQVAQTKGKKLSEINDLDLKTEYDATQGKKLNNYRKQIIETRKQQQQEVSPVETILAKSSGDRTDEETKVLEKYRAKVAKERGVEAATIQDDDLKKKVASVQSLSVKDKDITNADIMRDVTNSVSENKEEKTSSAFHSLFEKTHGAVVAEYVKKRGFRDAMQKMRRQDIFDEESSRDGEDLAFRKLGSRAKEIFKLQAGDLAAQWATGNPETRNTIAKNIDVIVEWAVEDKKKQLTGEKSELTDEQYKNIQGLINTALQTGKYIDKDTTIFDDQGLVAKDQIEVITRIKEKAETDANKVRVDQKRPEVIVDTSAVSKNLTTAVDKDKKVVSAGYSPTAKKKVDEAGKEIKVAQQEVDKAVKAVLAATQKLADHTNVRTAQERLIEKLPDDSPEKMQAGVRLNELIAIVADLERTVKEAEEERQKAEEEKRKKEEKKRELEKIYTSAPTVSTQPPPSEPSSTPLA